MKTSVPASLISPGVPLADRPLSDVFAGQSVERGQAPRVLELEIELDHVLRWTVEAAALLLELIAYYDVEVEDRRELPREQRGVESITMPAEYVARVQDVIDSYPPPYCEPVGEKARALVATLKALRAGGWPRGHREPAAVVDEPEHTPPASPSTSSKKGRHK